MPTRTIFATAMSFLLVSAIGLGSETTQRSKQTFSLADAIPYPKTTLEDDLKITSKVDLDQIVDWLLETQDELVKDYFGGGVKVLDRHEKSTIDTSGVYYDLQRGENASEAAEEAVDQTLTMIDDLILLLMDLLGLTFEEAEALLDELLAQHDLEDLHAILSDINDPASLQYLLMLLIGDSNEVTKSVQESLHDAMMQIIGNI